MKLPRLPKVLRELGVVAAAALALALVVGVGIRCTATSGGTARGIAFPSVNLSNTLTVVNAKAYGATGDGATDDRAAVSNAFSAACAAGAQEVFLPPGTYNWSRNGSNPYSIDLPCGDIVLRGVKGKTIIRHPTGLPNASVSLLRVNEKKNVVIRDIIFDGNWGNCVTRITKTSQAVTLNGASTINVEDASCFPAGTFGGVLSDSAGSEYINCTGKTSTTLTGCTAGAFAGGSAIGTLYEGQQVGYVDYGAGINQTTATTRTTTIAAGSNGQTLPQSTINVASTAAFTGFSSGDTVHLNTSFGYQAITCTGTSGGNQFTGCTGGTGTLSTGGEVFNGQSPDNNLLMLRGVENVTLEDLDMRQAYGDCIWIGNGASGGVGNVSKNVRVHNVNCKVAARNGISLIGSEDVVIDNFWTQDILAQAIDAEPVSTFNRNVVISHSVLSGWFSHETHPNGGGNPLSIVGGKDDGIWQDSDTARSWHVHDNTIKGVTFIEKSSAVTFENNRVVMDSSAQNSAAVLVEFGSKNLSILNNYIYTRGTTGGLESGADLAGIEVFGYQSGSFESSPVSLEIAGNYIEARNGRHGISIKGGGGKTSNESGTATTITNDTLADSGKSWTTNQWAGYLVRRGAAIATVDSNTATTLTLVRSTIPLNGASCSGAVSSTCSTAWTTGTGNQTATPSTGTYVILRPTGMISIHDNHIDLTDDGAGKGKYGINISNGSNNDTMLRVQVRRNHVRNCDTNAYRLRFDTITAYPYVELSDNDANDDQPSATCTNLVRIDNAINATKFIMGGNIQGEGITNATSNLTAGTWIVRDGKKQDWAGFGSPVSVVTAPVGSTYAQIDGSGDTAFWVKVGSGGTAWNKRSQIEHLITGESGDGHHDTKGIAPAITSCGTSPSAVTGDDLSGHFTEGSVATGCTLTFHTAYAAAPTCTVSSRAGLVFTYTTSTTALTITNVGALSSTTLDYECHGH